MSVTIDSSLEEAASVRPRPSRPRPASESDPLRLLGVRANLLPAEIVAARRVDIVRRRVLLGLVTLAALLALGYAGSWWQTHSAENELASAQAQGSVLQAQSRSFGPLVSAQAQTSTIRSELAQVMTGDLSWQHMLGALQSAAPAGVRLIQVNGSATTGSGAGAPSGTGGANANPGPQSLMPASVRQAGTLTINATAHDQAAVANYADVLGRTKGLASPFITSVTKGPNGVTFGMTVVITSDALGGRYSTPAQGAGTTGGK